MDKAQLLLLADAHKEQIFSKLHELVPGRMARLDRSVFEGKTTEDAHLCTGHCRKAFHEAAGGPAEDPHRFDSEGKGWLVSYCLKHSTVDKVWYLQCFRADKNDDYHFGEFGRKPLGC